MQDNKDIAISLFSEILTVEQLLRSRLAKVLPKGMELSHFSVLNHLSHINDERTPAQLAKSFHVTRGAMTNTLRKLVAISPAGRLARDTAIGAVAPVIKDVVGEMGVETLKSTLPVLRDLRLRLE